MDDDLLYRYSTPGSTRLGKAQPIHEELYLLSGLSFLVQSQDFGGLCNMGRFLSTTHFPGKPRSTAGLRMAHLPNFYLQLHARTRVYPLSFYSPATEASSVNGSC